MYGEDGGFGGGASSAAPGGHRRTPSGVIGRSQTFSPETQVRCSVATFAALPPFQGAAGSA